MARFTKALRQQLVRECAERNGGWYDPAIFLAEVRKQGKKHLAYEWFEWDDSGAAHQYRLDQARDFARGLTIKFEVRTVHRGAMRIVERSAPLALSPISGRNDYGGYYMLDPNDPAHMEELCRQAAQSLRWFLSRYGAALAHIGANVGVFEKAQLALEATAVREEAA